MKKDSWLSKLGHALLAFFFKGWLPGTVLCFAFDAFTSAKAAEGGPPIPLLWKTIWTTFLAAVFCLVFGWVSKEEAR